MSKPSEEISNYNASATGKTDANLANDANNLGGIPAEQYATKKYVQEYHDNKEEKLTEYIDAQDETNLEKAKSYADTAISNQDFSNFAKITDVSTLKKNLSEQIESCQTECANNLKTQLNDVEEQISGVVEDVNANFDDVNTAINTLNTTTNELFQSVSNGKQKVATAITDKGVETASDATYDEMATNIGKITTSNDTDGNYVNTEDATATKKDILLGKTAYAQGEKLTGTLVNMIDYPTTGIDTSDATATASDISYGKTAYANNEKLIGTASFVSYNNSDGTSSSGVGIQEIYGTLGDSYQNVNLGFAKDAPPDGADAVTTVSKVKFSPNMNYCVRQVEVNDADGNSTTYLESFAISSNGLQYQASSGVTTDTTYKKYRYSMSDLGLPDDTKIDDFAIGTGGFRGISNEAIFAIAGYYPNNDGTYTNTSFVKFFTYHLSENGAIGKTYSTENVIDYTYTPDKYVSMICSSPTEWNVFYGLETYGSYINSKYYHYKRLGVYSIYLNTNNEYYVLPVNRNI